MVRRRKKKSKFGAYAIMAFMVLVMVGSLMGVILFAPQATGEIVYGDLTFEIDQSSGLYTTTHNGQSYRFNNPPFTALSVPTDPQAISILQVAPLKILTFDPSLDEESLAYVDFVRFELASIIPGLGGGITQPSETYKLPLVDCINASPQTPVIKLEAGIPAIRADGFCVILSGNQTTLLLAKDALIYNYFNLIEAEEYVPPRPVHNTM